MMKYLNDYFSELRKWSRDETGFEPVNLPRQRSLPINCHQFQHQRIFQFIHLHLGLKQ